MFIGGDSSLSLKKVINEGVASIISPKQARNANANNCTDWYVGRNEGVDTAAFKRNQAALKNPRRRPRNNEVIFAKVLPTIKSGAAIIIFMNINNGGTPRTLQGAVVF